MPIAAEHPTAGLVRFLQDGDDLRVIGHCFDIGDLGEWTKKGCQPLLAGAIDGLVAQKKDVMAMQGGLERGGVIRQRAGS